MSYIQSAFYLFGFKTTYDEHEGSSHSLCATLLKPEKVKSIIGETEAFQQFFGHDSIHQFKLNEADEFFDEEDSESEDNSFFVGFQTSFVLSQKELETLYHQIFIPVFIHLFENVTPTNRILTREERVFTNEHIVSGDSQLNKFYQRAITSNDIAEVVANFKEVSFSTHFPEHKHTVERYVTSRNKIINLMQKGFFFADMFEDEPKERALKLTELGVLNLVMPAHKRGITNPSEAFNFLHEQTRIKAIKDFAEE